jgi:hypothetical protein
VKKAKKDFRKSKRIHTLKKICLQIQKKTYNKEAILELTQTKMHLKKINSAKVNKKLMLKPTRNLRQRKGKDAFSVQPATE